MSVKTHTDTHAHTYILGSSRKTKVFVAVDSEPISIN